MIETAEVIALQDGFIKVKKTNQDSCNACRIRHICGGENLPELTISTDESFQIGEIIELIIEPKMRVFSGFLFFIFPTLIFVSFFCISFLVFTLSEQLSILVAFISLPLSFFLVVLYSKIFAQKMDISVRKLYPNL